MSITLSDEEKTRVKQYVKKSTVGMKYRSELEIIACMLEVSQPGTTRTRIMFHSYISYVQLKSYLALCLEGGLLERKGELYFTTIKGATFLNTWRELCHYLPALVHEATSFAKS